MAKIPKKDINLYTLAVVPKKATMKKGVLYAVIGIAAVVLLGGSFAGAKIYVITQEHIAAELEEKSNDEALLAKIANANDVAADITTMRIAGNTYSQVREEIDSGQVYCDNFSSALIDQLISCEKYTISESYEQIATITKLAYDGTTLVITANSTDSRYVSYFVTNLSRLGLFSDISYSGYTLSNDVYTYDITAVFQEAAVTTEETTEVAQ